MGGKMLLGDGGDAEMMGVGAGGRLEGGGKSVEERSEEMEKTRIGEREGEGRVV